jgi:radical SAM superfamily enzyme YgiQ (UPF0313 family)
MSLKCVLVNPIELTHPTFGLLYIASVLESRGHYVRIKEIPSEILVPFPVSVKRLVRYFKDIEPDLIGITCMASQADKVRQLIGYIKESKIPAKIAVGGVHPSFMPEEVMSWGSDYVIVNEGEETIVELAEAIEGKKEFSQIKGIYYRQGRGIYHTPARDVIEHLDSIPLPAYHLIGKERFVKRKGEIRGLWLRCGWILTSRGCPSSCTFCSNHRMFGKRIRYRSVNNIFKELHYLIKMFKIEAFYIMDDTFTISKKHIREFCNCMQKYFPRLIWACQARVNFFDEEIAANLKKGGCVQVDFGVESGSQRILDSLKKGIRIEEIIKAFDVCKRVKLRTLATVMVGNPGEDLNDIENTKWLLRKINPDFVGAYFTTPFPGTELYRLAISGGFLSRKSEKRWHQLDGPLSWIKTSKENVQKAQKELMKFNVLKHYLLNLVFYYDMAKFAFINPKVFLKIVINILKGDTKKAFYIITTLNYLKKINLRNIN